MTIFIHVSQPAVSVWGVPKVLEVRKSLLLKDKT